MTSKCSPIARSTSSAGRRCRRVGSPSRCPTSRARTCSRCCRRREKVHIRWDASTIDVVPAEPAAVDPDDARVELARRFLRRLGPAGPGQFARWAGVLVGEARATWQALAARHPLVPIAVEGRGRWLLAEDLDALRAAEPLAGVRLLPLGDPVLYLDKGLVVPPVPEHLADRRPQGDVTQRLLNSLRGRVVVDGQIVAS